MKRFFKVWMIVAVTAIIAIGLAGCDLDGDDDDGGFSWPEGIKNTTWVSESGLSFFSFFENSDLGGSYINGRGGAEAVTSGSAKATEGEFKTRNGVEYTYTITGEGDARTLVVTQGGSAYGTYTYSGAYTN